MTGKKGLKEAKHFKSQDLQMQSMCVFVHVFVCGEISVFAYAGVSLLCSIKMPVISSSLCVRTCVCWCSPLCSCDPWDSGWAVTLLISPSRNTAWKMSSEHSELCLHSLQVPSLLIWQVIITHAPLPLPSRGLRHKNKEEEGKWRRQNKGIKFHSQTCSSALNNQVIQTPRLE